MRILSESTPMYASTLTKVFVNGRWVGIVGNPNEVIDLFKKYRRSALLPTFTSIF